jgi:hypothetical protein
MANEFVAFQQDRKPHKKKLGREKKINRFSILVNKSNDSTNEERTFKGFFLLQNIKREQYKKTEKWMIISVF